MSLLAWLFCSADEKKELRYKELLRGIVNEQTRGNARNNDLTSLYRRGNPTKSEKVDKVIRYLFDNCRITSVEAIGYYSFIVFDNAVEVKFWAVNHFYSYASTIELRKITGENKAFFYNAEKIGLSYEAMYKLYDTENNYSNAHIEREVLEDTSPLLGSTCSECKEGPVHLFEDKRPVCQRCGATAQKTTFTDVDNLVVNLGFEEKEALINKLKEFLK